MFAQILDVAHLEALPFRGGDHRRGGHQITIGEDVSPNELVALPQASRNEIENAAMPGLLSAHDPVVEKQTAWLQRAVRDTEVFVESLDADMLDHADARDLVEG